MKEKFAYNIKKILLGILISELLFFALFAIILSLFGFFTSTIGSTSLAFKFPEKLNYLAIIIPLIALFWWYMKWKNQRFRTLGNLQVLASLISPVNSKKYFISYFLLRNALVFTIIAMAQPVFGSKKVNASLDSMELILAIDVSNSMNTKDISKEDSRLQIVKRAMIQLINNFHGEKLGICVFAGGAYLQLPITADYEAAKMYINEIETDMFSNQGTNIGAALELSSEMFSKEKTSKAILLVTDGENHEESYEEPLQAIKASKIMLGILGIGSKSGGPIPNDPLKPELGYKTTASGSTVISKLNENLIHSMANKSGGFSMISSTAYPDLSTILERFSHLKRTKIESIELDVKENWYQVPLLFALVFWVLFALVREGIILNKR
jgi:Ca-activated chloride channel family protein